MRRKLVAGNWKMQGDRASNAALLSALAAARLPPAVDVALMPPYPYLEQARTLLAGSTIGLGAQDCSAELPGAFTGEVAASKSSRKARRAFLFMPFTARIMVSGLTSIFSAVGMLHLPSET